MTTETTPATRKRRDRGETRQRLLESALAVFARNGYERATVDEIVREAGFSKGAFYVHFESKEDLFWEMLQERIDKQQELFRQAIDVSLSVEENEKRILQVVFASHDDPLGPAVFLEFAAHGMRNQKVQERLSEMYGRWHAFVSETLTAGREMGLVREDIDVSLLASAIMAIMEGGMIQSNLAPEHLRLNRRMDDFAHLLSELISKR
ncbi:MAG TPA: TetR/AcrR family transcriptional regulator [Dehalococcoidia bacterium]|jgi:AcrR family transcriptional regulator|nr:TetR/AcrR family transcriptional regulator [Dehalococcoidia bacterium]